MKAIVDAKEFSQALDKVSKVLNKSSGIPVLREVLVRFSGGRCALTGTDFDTWLVTEIPAQGDDFAFVFHRTADAAKACRRFDGELSFETAVVGSGSKQRLKVCMSCGHRVGEFDAFFPEDYPVIPSLDPEHSFMANAARLLERINRIKYATCKPYRDVNILSTCIQFSGDRVFCLDGIRAAWDTDKTLTVPTPFMAQVAPLEYLKFFGDQDVSVQMGKKYIDITDGTLHLRFRRVEAVLFNLNSAIPQTFREEIIVYPKDFLTELNYLKEIIPATKLSYVCFEDGRLFMQADGCRYQTQVRVDGHSGIAIGFNLRDLIDAFRQFKGASCVRMKLNTALSPAILKADGRGDCALVLPVRMKNNMAA